jgi:GntR family transcriptional regulator/MocR family aminotransferase
MTTSRADLPLVVDRSAASPLAEQLISQLRTVVTSGVLVAGERLPSSRDLAATLGVSRTVVTVAYTQLFAEGWLEGRHGSGTYVANVSPAPPATADPARVPASVPNRAIGAAPASPNAYTGTLPDVPKSAIRHAAGRPERGADLIQLQPGIPWVAGIDPAMWRRAWRHAGTRPPSFWPDPHGVPDLRAGLAGYLRRSRALAITSDSILVTRGVSSGLTLLAAALIRPGDRAGVEEPGYPAAREVLRRAGAEVIPCPVDEHGIVPDGLPGDLRLLYTTPAHQYPLGGRLPVARRQALVAWARATGALIVEDDYDGEFRYDVAPLPALYSMDPEVVVYLGTASKMLTPAFGIGWLVAAPAVVALLARTRAEMSDRVPEPAQHAMHALLTSGDLERHVRRMRLEYARRRATLVDRLSASLPETFRVLGDTAGMHVVLELPPGCHPDRLVALAAESGISLFTIDRYYVGRPTVNGLILGYGAAPLTHLRRAATALRFLVPGLTRSA